MANKFTLDPKPTFRRKVAIHIPGEKDGEIEFIFKHRTRDEYRDFLQSLGPDKTDVEVIMDVASGWNLVEPFDEESIERLTLGFIGSARAVLDAYVNELTGARLGN
jgi:tail assembly chaperone